MRDAVELRVDLTAVPIGHGLFPVLSSRASRSCGETRDPERNPTAQRLGPGSSLRSTGMTMWLRDRGKGELTGALERDLERHLAVVAAAEIKSGDLERTFDRAEVGHD